MVEVIQPRRAKSPAHNHANVVPSAPVASASSGRLGVRKKHESGRLKNLPQPEAILETAHRTHQPVPAGSGGCLYVHCGELPGTGSVDIEPNERSSSGLLSRVLPDES